MDYLLKKPSMLDKFQRRDINENLCLEQLTYLQFNMKYSPTNEEPKQNNLLSLAYHKDEPEWEQDEDMNLIVTHDFCVNEFHYTLPRYIKLFDLRPGEPKYMKRKSRFVVRFHKIDRTKSPHEFHFAQLQLYSAFRNENELMPNDFQGCKLLFDETSQHNGMRKIDNVKSVLMPYLENVETQREKAELLVETDVGDILDSALEQDNDDCLDMEVEDHSDFAFKDPSDIFDGADKQNRYKSILLEDDGSLESMSQKLDKDQRLVFDICIDYATSVKKSRKNSSVPINPPLLVVQGGAGSGKSCVIEAISQHMEKIFRSPGDNPDHPYIIKAAFTGTAAANIKGQTLHHAFSFGFGNEFFSLSDNARDEHQSELKKILKSLS